DRGRRIGRVVDEGGIDRVAAALAVRVRQTGVEPVELLLSEGGEPAGLRVDEGDVDRAGGMRARATGGGRRKRGEEQSDPAQEQRRPLPASCHVDPPRREMNRARENMRPDSGLMSLGIRPVKRLDPCSADRARHDERCAWFAGVERRERRKGRFRRAGNDRYLVRLRRTRYLPRLPLGAFFYGLV